MGSRGPLSRLAKAAVGAVSRADHPDTIVKIQDVIDRARKDLEELK